MGCFVSCLATEAACCVGKGACGLFGCFNWRSSVATRVAYALILLANSFLAWFALSDWAERKLGELTFGFFKLNCPQGSCFGVLAVHRITFALSFLHLILAMLTANVQSTKDKWASAQNRYWGFKLLAWILLVVASFFIPNGFFIVWGNYVSVIGSFAFILLQLLLLVDFSFSFSETLLAKWEESEHKGWLFALIGSSFGLLILSGVMDGLLYAWFSACQLNQFFITFNLFLNLVAVVLSVHPKIQEVLPSAGLTQSGIVVAYATYLITSAVANEPEDIQCSSYGSETSKKSSAFLGAVFTFLAIAYSTARIGTRGDSFSGDADRQPLTASEMRANALNAAVESGAISERDAEEDNDDEEQGLAYSYSFFHLMFFLANSYVAMLLTNWNTIESSNGLVIVGQSWAAVWVKVVSSWVVHLLFSWTLLGPVFFPERFVTD